MEFVRRWALPIALFAGLLVEAVILLRLEGPTPQAIFYISIFSLFAI